MGKGFVEDRLRAMALGLSFKKQDASLAAVHSLILRVCVILFPSHAKQPIILLDSGEF
jgi:hypothetical protein